MDLQKNCKKLQAVFRTTARGLTLQNGGCWGERGKNSGQTVSVFGRIFSMNTNDKDCRDCKWLSEDGHTDEHDFFCTHDFIDMMEIPEPYPVEIANGCDFYEEREELFYWHEYWPIALRRERPEHFADYLERLKRKPKVNPESNSIEPS